MTYLPDNSISSYVPKDVILPENPEDLRRVLNDTLRRFIDAINVRDIGIYDSIETVNGQSWFNPNNPQEFKSVYRKVIDFGALPNAGIKDVAHGITTTEETRFVRIYGCATDPGVATITGALPLPYVSVVALNAGVRLFVNAANVRIETAIDYSAYTTCYVVLEYLQY